MLKRVLVANRGEIAVRIIRSCREMGIETVAVYAEEDADALHTQLADQAICIGRGDVRKSYLNISNVISAALLTGADAVHPGYGFLSENATFARTLQNVGLIFIGPEADLIDRMGDKARARQTMIEAGVPVVPGSVGTIDHMSDAREEALRIGFPVLVKAASGGGGRGMRISMDEADFQEAFSQARSEAEIAFGDGAVYIEKFVQKPRHVEVQILADHHGNVIHLGERDCSMQRRNQKVVEEAPAPGLTPEVRAGLHEAAVKAAQYVNYRSAGTLEFLLAPDGKFYFIEMNTRVQVEHPVSELITGVDIIAEQIRIAAGEPLQYRQEDICFRGHAMECRINAEDPARNFMPSPGLIEELHLPGGFGVRVDGAIYQGLTISSRFDSMLAKLIVHGTTRDEAIARMRRALSEFVITGPKTKSEFQLKLTGLKEFQEGQIHTGLIMEKNWSE